MWSRLTSTSLASATLAHVKTHLRYSGRSEDTLITDYFDVAVARVENATGLQIGAGTFVAKLQAFPANGTRLYLSPRPLATVSSISYVNTAGDLVSWDSGKYVVNTVPNGYVEPVFGATWPVDVGGTISILYSAGIMTWGGVPAQAKHAILMLTEHYFDQRAPVAVGVSGSLLPETIETLLTQLSVGDEFAVLA